MRTRKTFIHEDGIYEGVSRLPEPREYNPVEVVSLNDSYDWYPEKQSVHKKETVKFEGTIDLPLGEEYKLQSQFENYSYTLNKDIYALAGQQEEVYNTAVK